MSEQPTREMSKTIGGISMVALVHMAIDLMVAAALFFLIKKKTSYLQAQIDKLNERLVDQENINKQQHDVLVQILNGGSLPPMRYEQRPSPPVQPTTPIPPQHAVEKKSQQPIEKKRSGEGSQESSRDGSLSNAPRRQPHPTVVLASDTEYTEGEPDDDSLDAIINEEFENERDLNCDEEQSTTVEKKNVTDADQ